MGLYAKQSFKKIVKRLQEDSSSIWYDHQELELLEYEETCENYEKLQAQGGHTIPAQQRAIFNQILKDAASDPVRQQMIYDKHMTHEKQLNEIVINPSHLILPQSYNMFPCPVDGQSFKKSPSLINWRLIETKMCWGVLFLLGGGFTLAKCLQTSGLSLMLVAQLKK